MKYYLASPFFNQEERKNVQKVANNLRLDGDEVYVPMEHSIPDGWNLPNNEWARQVFEEDVKAIRECDCVLAITYGMKDDAGTAWEVGFAYGIGKPVSVIAVNQTTYSLMVYQSAASISDLAGFPLSKKKFLQS